MSITALKNQADILSEHNYMWHGETLSENYGASKEIMNEFWELVTKRIDEAIDRVSDDMNKILDEIVKKHNLTYIEVA